MRVVVVRHHEQDDPGFVGESLRRRGADLEMHLVGAGTVFPALAGVDAIVVLGATWSVYDRAAVGSWIEDELAWLRRAEAEGVAILGICFGAQALSAAFGGGVEPARRHEIGWVDIDTTAPEIVGPGPWFEFHGDRCVVPPVATVLATNELGVQAFSIGRHLGVQFHPEVDGDQLDRWLQHGEGATLREHGIDPSKLLSATRAEEPAARRRADELVGAFLVRRQGHGPLARRRC